MFYWRRYLLTDWRTGDSALLAVCVLDPKTKQYRFRWRKSFAGIEAFFGLDPGVLEEMGNGGYDDDAKIERMTSMGMNHFENRHPIEWDNFVASRKWHTRGHDDVDDILDFLTRDLRGFEEVVAPS